MSLLQILICGDARQGQVAAQVDRITPGTRAQADDMIETMYGAPGRGLAAPQVGQMLRMFVMDFHWKDGADRAPPVMVTPDITARSATEAVHDEGFLSIPGVTVPVRRPARVSLRWQGLEGATHVCAFDGIEAVCAQHEDDHLDRILNIDRVAPDVRDRIGDALRTLAA